MRAHARFEEHVGEWKVALWADTLEDLFVEAARVVSRACGPVSGPPGRWETVSLAAQDAASLLADWMNELLGRSEVSGYAYDEVRNLRIVDARLQAEVRGRPVTVWCSPIKAATYHDLTIEREHDRWRAAVLLDV